ncbi:MAG TPA: hypothetical protein DC013_03310 [Ruminococcaceae bacterium]|jgi:Na+-transporting methylmalonyl-CoA/oxaloacetate decarboxylase gamma subunit|nr:hypothetical protein [Oscillospiraceae bacterium]
MMIRKKEVKQMSLFQSIFTALFCMSVVFLVLVLLWIIVRLFSVLIRRLEKQNRAATAKHPKS